MCAQAVGGGLGGQAALVSDVTAHYRWLVATRCAIQIDVLPFTLPYLVALLHCGCGTLRVTSRYTECRWKTRIRGLLFIKLDQYRPINR